MDPNVKGGGGGGEQSGPVGGVPDVSSGAAGGVQGNGGTGDGDGGATAIPPAPPPSTVDMTEDTVDDGGGEKTPLLATNSGDPEKAEGKPADAAAEEEEEEDEFHLGTTEERKAQGLCCPSVNRHLLLSKSFYFCFFSAWGSLLPYMALYFKQLMLTPSQVGVIMGLKPFVNFLATPVWGAIVDKFHIHKFALLISMTALITSTFALSLVPGPKQQTIILQKHCNRTDEMTEMDALIGETGIDKMVLSDASQDFYFSKSRWPWPIDFIASFEENIYVRYKIDASKTFTMLFLITLFGNLIASPTLALVDTATLQMLAKETHRYGKQRLMGSLGWGLGAFIVGASLKTTHHCSMSKSREIVDYIPCFYSFAILMFLGLCVSMKFKFRVQKKKKGSSVSLAKGLVALKYPTYMMFLFTALYLGFLMAFIKTFLFWHLKDLGGTQLLFSVISAVNCVAEVSMYFLSERLIAKIGEIRVLYIGLICYSIRLFYYSVLPYPWLVLVVELLPGITTAAVWAACLSYVSINSRPGAQTTMQCILHSVHWGLGYGAGEVIGGILVHHYGAPKTFVLFGILCIIILFVYFLVRWVWGNSEAQMLRENELHSRGENPEPAEEQTEELLGEEKKIDLGGGDAASLLDKEVKALPPPPPPSSGVDEVDTTNTQHTDSCLVEDSLDIDRSQQPEPEEPPAQQQLQVQSEIVTLNDGKPILLSVDK